MQYVRSISGSVSKTWNSINPATLSGAIDVIVVEHEDGSLACSPFHVRFGKFSLLRPSEKKVEFKVNEVQQDYSMKLGDGGEAFFVFETTGDVPENLQTSPLVSPAASPEAKPAIPSIESGIQGDPEPLDLDETEKASSRRLQASITQQMPILIPDRRTQSDVGAASLSASFPEEHQRPSIANWTNSVGGTSVNNSLKPHDLAMTPMSSNHQRNSSLDSLRNGQSGRRFQSEEPIISNESISSSPVLSPSEALTRAVNLSKKLWSSNIPSHITDNGDLMLDMTGYKSTEDEVLRAEIIARKILADDLASEYDIGSLIGADEKGNIWIYNSEESKEAAARKVNLNTLLPRASMSSDALSDPGYHSDMESQKSLDLVEQKERRESDSAVDGLGTPPDSPASAAVAEPSRNYAKTLRLTSDQLKALDLKPGANPLSFSVNRAICTAYMYLWKWNVPIVISDIDGTITKSDALGHVLNMIGRDWTHLGVAKLYSDIVANGYNILYLTSRSVGQADTTRTYINGIVQEGYKLPKGPVIMSPDRTIAALRREIYLRKPEVFKMACLRDIMSLFNQRKSPFYSGFGNRLTDALSYRSVNIPSTRIFTINSDAEVSLDLLSLNKYKTGYTSMREIVDHFFPPIGMLVQEGGEAFTDFNYWRENPLDIEDFSDTDSDTGNLSLSRMMSEDEHDDDVFSDDLEGDILSRGSIDDTIGTLARQSMDTDNSRVEIFGGKDNEILEELSDDEEGEDSDALDLVAAAAAAASKPRTKTSPNNSRPQPNEKQRARSHTGSSRDNKGQS